ncbi:hypothetical protein BCR39DRAFT_507752 [Naematelia encephala]|uniref:Cyclin-domain-containing protein n=1 Tax=Naematelia encephala TaxID=71784 RepID=A0A1Y2AMA1_9TREE|nr:hypothetical protein BCR39DRAFT_507752 [Naematelia encephala]
MSMCSTTVPPPRHYMNYENDSLDPLPLTPSTLVQLPHYSPLYEASCYPEAYIDLDSEQDPQYGYESDCDCDQPESHYRGGGPPRVDLPSSYIFPSSTIPSPCQSLVHQSSLVPPLGHSHNHSPHPLTPPLLHDDRPIPVQSRMNPIDMNMAVPGTMAASPGINTPLAQYAASMVAWLWYGNHSPSNLQDATFGASSPRMTSTPDPFLAAPINHDQVVPSPYFLDFVSRMLRLTQVSHSVTLIALLYIYRLKARKPMVPQSGSEMRPFVASLILGNKYLDDNTYTNKTWAELAGIPQGDVNKMEQEFLIGMNYDLSVSVNEYRVWLGMLDGFIAARQRDALGRHWYHSRSPFVFPQTIDPVGMTYRARSASPPSASTAVQPYIYPPSPPHARKRSAVDAFAYEIPSVTPTTIYEQLRFPTRKAQFQRIYAPPPSVASVASVASVVSAPQLHPESSQSSLGRSGSLNRQIARLPGDHTFRRGSVGNVASEENESPLVSDYQQHQQSAPIEWTGPSELIRPYERPPQGLPVQHGDMAFYAAAADPHPGPDGAPRKGILRQQPAFPPYATQLHPTYGYLVPGQPFPENMGGMGYDHSPMPYTSASFQVQPELGQFANAGPPGWVYHARPPQRPASNTATQRWSMGSDEGLQDLHAAQLAMMGDAWRTRSAWNSPMTGNGTTSYFDANYSTDST